MTMLEKLSEKGMAVGLIQKLPIICTNILLLIFLVVIFGTLPFTEYWNLRAPLIFFLCLFVWLLGALFGSKIILIQIEEIEEEEEN